MSSGKVLRELLAQEDIIVAPGATNALVARIAQEAGFKAIYTTGAGISNTLLGLTDVGLISMGELLDQVRRITAATDLPVISDADTGYGNVINVIRTVKEFERAGVAAIHLEDQVFPKRCGHFDGKQVIRKEEMVQKIKAAVDTRKDMLIIARTDARAIEGLESSLERAQAYIEAGADITFIEAPTSLEELERIPKALTVPQMANMVEGGKTPLVKREQLAKMGFKIVIYANLALKASVKAVQEAFANLAIEGSSENFLNRIITVEERNRITLLPEIKQLQQKYSYE